MLLKSYLFKDFPGGQTMIELDNVTKILAQFSTKQSPTIGMAQLECLIFELVIDGKSFL
jgi:hypothetical protein